MPPSPTAVSPTDETDEIGGPPKAISNLAVPAAAAAVATATGAAAPRPSSPAISPPSWRRTLAAAATPSRRPRHQARRGAGLQPPTRRRAGATKPATKKEPAGPQEGKAKATTQGGQGGGQATGPPAATTPAAGRSRPRRCQPRRNRSGAVGFPGSLGLFLLAALGGLGYLAWMLFRTPTHEVPAVVGLPQDEALALVDDFEWDITVDEGRSDEYRTPGQIIRTSPPAGEDLAEGSPLLLVVSEGPEFRSVPDLSGMTLADAQAEIERLELVAAEPTTEYDEDVPAGTVISSSVQGVPLGGDVLPGAEVELVVSDGPQPRRVPQLRGLSTEEATQLLGDLGLVLAVGEEVFDDEVPAGEIATQTPAVDTTLDRGGTITANVSKGPDLVTFPDLTGMTLPQIGQALTDAGLRVGNLLGSTQGTFVAASIDGDEVAAGDQVRRNSAVNIIILV